MLEADECFSLCHHTIEVGVRRREREGSLQGEGRADLHLSDDGFNNHLSSTIGPFFLAFSPPACRSNRLGMNWKHYLYVAEYYRPSPPYPAGLEHRDRYSGSRGGGCVIKASKQSHTHRKASKASHIHSLPSILVIEREAFTHS